MVAAMLSAYGKNDLLATMELLAGDSVDLGSVEEAFGSTKGDFAASSRLRCRRPP
jgi:hypothetical protein